MNIRRGIMKDIIRSEFFGWKRVLDNMIMREKIMGLKMWAN